MFIAAGQVLVPAQLPLTSAGLLLKQGAQDPALHLPKAETGGVGGGTEGRIRSRGEKKKREKEITSIRRSMLLLKMSLSKVVK